MTALLLDPVAGLLLSALLTLALFVALARDARSRWLLLLGLLPGVMIYLFTPCVRIFSNHGFLHTSIVYQLLNGFMPPMDALYAGNQQLYPWAHAVLLAGLVRGLHVSPGIAFALINNIALLGTMIFVARIAMSLTSSRSTSIFASVLSVFGLTLFSQGPIAGVLRGLIRPFLHADPLEWRAMVAVKFFNASGMPLAIMFFALFIYTSMRIYSKPAGSRVHYGLLALSVVGTGYIYPLTWLTLMACACAICLAMLILQRRTVWPTIIRYLMTVAVGTLAVFPYLHQLGAGKSGTSIAIASDSRVASFVLVPDLESVFVKAVRLGLYMLPLALVLLWKRKALADLWRDRKASSAILAATLATTLSLYLFVSVTPTLANEYKFLLHGCIPLGIVGSVAMNAVYLRHKLACSLLVFSFLVPICSAWVAQLAWRECSDEIEEGMYLRFRDPARDELYRWISEQTRPDSVFVDTQLSIPVFGRRQLYVGLGEWGQGGWTASPNSTLMALQHPEDEIKSRERVARSLFNNYPEVEDGITDELIRTTGTSDVYILIRDKRLGHRKFTSDAAFARVFEGDEATVYQFLKGGS